MDADQPKVLELNQRSDGEHRSEEEGETYEKRVSRRDRPANYRTRKVSTKRQIKANRRNAARSTGPHTAEGKRIAALNAWKHGLTAQTVVLADEDPDQFERFARLIRIDWTPEGEMETIWVERIVNLSWRLRRLPKIEAGLLSFEYASAVAGETEGPETFSRALAGAFTSELIEKLGKYDTSIQNKLLGAMRALKDLQDRRRERELNPDIEFSWKQELRRFVDDFHEGEARFVHDFREGAARTKAPEPELLLSRSQGPQEIAPGTALDEFHRVEQMSHGGAPTTAPSSGAPQSAREVKVKRNLT